MGMKYEGLPTYYSGYNPIYPYVYQEYQVNENDLKNGLVLPLSPLVQRPMYYDQSTYLSNSLYEPDGVNNDKDLHRSVSKYFYEKFKTKWMREYYNDLFKYFKIGDSGVEFIRSLDQIDTDTKNNDIKAEYITRTIFSKIDMEALLEKYVKKHHANWFELRSKHKSRIRQYIHDKIKNHIKNRIVGF